MGDGADADMAFKTLIELSYLEPQEPDIHVMIIGKGDIRTEDPEYNVKSMHYKM